MIRNVGTFLCTIYNYELKLTDVSLLLSLTFQKGLYFRMEVVHSYSCQNVTDSLPLYSDVFKQAP
jgi:hypothetical protein